MDNRVGLIGLLTLVGTLLVMLSLFTMMGRSITVILAVENLNSLVLAVVLLSGYGSSYCLYVSLMVLLVVESIIFLSCLVVVWSSQSYMIDLGGF